MLCCIFIKTQFFVKIKLCKYTKDSFFVHNIFIFYCYDNFSSEER